MRYAYPGCSDEEMVEVHEARMARLLETWKLKRAKEIARKRLAGYEIPPDALTEECQVAQAKEQYERLQLEVMELQLQRAVAKGPANVRALICRQILALAEMCPDGTPQSFANTLKVPLRTMQRYVAALVKSGAIIRQHDGWQVPKAA